MDSKTISILSEQFDEIAQLEASENVEFWYARELQERLGYSRWENFLHVIEKATQACENSGNIISNHFRGVTKMVAIGSGSERKVEDIQLTRYACYLVAQNGDPKKEIIAFAQSYFATQTRKQEILEERMKFCSRMEARNVYGNLKKFFHRPSMNVVSMNRVSAEYDPRVIVPCLVEILRRR